jgi:hypothetical protein
MLTQRVRLERIGVADLRAGRACHAYDQQYYEGFVRFSNG